MAFEDLSSIFGAYFTCMTRSKKPVVIVALALAALILIPFLILLFSRLDGSNDGSEEGRKPVKSATATEVAGFDLRQLSEKADALIENEIAEALRNGDVSLDFVSDLKELDQEGDTALAKGKLDRASAAYKELIAEAEAELAALALGDKARSLNNDTYAELQRLEFLKTAFENTYRDAVENYNAALKALNSGDFQKSVDGFEMTEAILGDMEARAIQQKASLIEAGQTALANYELVQARSAFESVLEIDSGNVEATEGLAMATALEGIADEVQAIRALEAQGDLDGALAQLDQLAAANPQNPYLSNQRAVLEKRVIERDFEKLVASSVEAEKLGDFSGAITAVEAALALKADVTQQSRLAELKKAYKAARLETLLADGFTALQSGRFEAARNFYKEATALAPDSKEARTGLEKASSLYLANIRYSQNLVAAQKQIAAGRYPLAAKLFNDAMVSRPSSLPPSKVAEEARIRSILDAQSSEVKILIESDKKTYVSMIGVLPPDRFKEEELSLFPDVYKVRGTRKGYRDVQFELKVDATKGTQTITVECTEKL